MIVLYYVEGFKMSEIAEILDIPEATVRTRIARARKKMAEEYYPEAEKMCIRDRYPAASLHIILFLLTRIRTAFLGFLKYIV